MVKTTLIAATALAAICSTATIVEAFSTTRTCQSPRINALSASVTSKCASTRSINSSSTRLNMHLPRRNNNSNKSVSSLFPIKSSQQLGKTVIHLIQRLRKSFTIVLAALTILFSTTTSSSSRFVPHAHAASSAAVSSSLVTKSSSSWVQTLNPFRTKSTNELIDNYVRDRLFADDEYDPVESAYREAYADSSSSSSSDSSSSTGAYPTLLAETASTALGKKQDISSLLSSSKTTGGTTSSTSGGMDSAKKDGITAILIKSSDFLQRRLKVSASISYYIIAASGILSLCVLPGMIGVLYQGIQRLQIDKSEMKMYGKISDMDATRKRITDDDDDDDDDDDE